MKPTASQVVTAPDCGLACAAATNGCLDTRCSWWAVSRATGWVMISTGLCLDNLTPDEQRMLALFALEAGR